MTPVKSNAVHCCLTGLVKWWARRNGMMLVPASRFSADVIGRTRKALKDDDAGNRKCTMTDLDLACDMLDELNQFNSPVKHAERRARQEKLWNES